MNALVIDGDALRALRAYAEAAPIPVDEVRRIAAGEAPPAGDRPGYVARLPVGWRVVFSIEEHPRRDGSGTVWFRRLSVSGPAPGRFAAPVALGELARPLGFPPLAHCAVDFDPSGVAVQVVADRDASFTCPDCGRTSFNPGDARERYCAACGRWS